MSDVSVGVRMREELLLSSNPIIAARARERAHYSNEKYKLVSNIIKIPIAKVMNPPYNRPSERERARARCSLGEHLIPQIITSIMFCTAPRAWWGGKRRLLHDNYYYPLWQRRNCAFVLSWDCVVGYPSSYSYAEFAGWKISICYWGKEILNHNFYWNKNWFLNDGLFILHVIFSCSSNFDIFNCHS